MARTKRETEFAIRVKPTGKRSWVWMVNGKGLETFPNRDIAQNRMKDCKVFAGILSGIAGEWQVVEVYKPVSA